MRQRPRKRDKARYLFPCTLDLPIAIGGSHHAIARAVGDFYEEVTCQLLNTDRLKADGQVFCPDTFIEDEFYEVKGSGQSRWIIEERQLGVYRDLLTDGKCLTYVLWSYSGRPALKSVCCTKRDVFDQLAQRTLCCWFLPVQIILGMAAKQERESFGHHNGSTVHYYRLRKGDLPGVSTANYTKWAVEIESVPFVLSAFEVRSAELRDNKSDDEVPF